MTMNLWDLQRAALQFLACGMLAWTVKELIRAVRGALRRRIGVIPRPTFASRGLLALSGILVATLGQYGGARFVGPAVRWLLGEPLDFMSDYTSPEAALQATLVQVGVVALLLGARRPKTRPDRSVS
jgi:hypothetical protein